MLNSDYSLTLKKLTSPRSMVDFPAFDVFKSRLDEMTCYRCNPYYELDAEIMSEVLWPGLFRTD